MANPMPYVSQILIYPIKSLDSVGVTQSTILKSSALSCDRKWALFDQFGRFVNGKRHAAIHAIRSKTNLQTNTVSLCIQDSNQVSTFQLDTEQVALEQWFSDYFNFPVTLKHNVDKGFPDDPISSGPTIISTATLATIASWYPDLNIEDIRRRFRANIEISGVPAFWEDRLFTTAKQTVPFQIGNVHFQGVNPCQRCVVITRDAKTGEADPNFQKIFMKKREETLPDWTMRSRFNHYFRLAVNTKLPPTEEGKIIAVGDEVKLASIELTNETD